MMLSLMAYADDFVFFYALAGNVLCIALVGKRIYVGGLMGVKLNF